MKPVFHYSKYRIAKTTPIASHREPIIKPFPAPGLKAISRKGPSDIDALAPKIIMALAVDEYLDVVD